MPTVELDWLHSLFQELENEGVELPMGDYGVVYEIIEAIRDDPVVYRLTVADLEAYAGRPVTEDEVAGFISAFPNSSLPECIETVLSSIIEEE